MPRWFEVDYKTLEKKLDQYVDQIFGDLESDFLTMPKGQGFVEYQQFEEAYRALCKTTDHFRDFHTDALLTCVCNNPLVLIVIRAILGFTPSEWAYLATQRSSVPVSQQAARAMDRYVRLHQQGPLPWSGSRKEKLRALLQAACDLLSHPPEKDASGLLHRLDKADTRQGLVSLRACAQLGVPYAMVLYERFLGRPFASHRDSVSELIACVLEGKIERILQDAGISYRKTGRAEQLPGFDQAPDFIVPDEFNPQVVIEAKITEDDGTARDKVTRIQHLAAMALESGQAESTPRFEVIACIAGRGFGVRRQDMRKLLRATRGKVFTPRTLEFLVPHTRLREFATS